MYMCAPLGLRCTRVLHWGCNARVCSTGAAIYVCAVNVIARLALPDACVQPCTAVPGRLHVSNLFHSCAWKAGAVTSRARQWAPELQLFSVRMSWHASGTAMPRWWACTESTRLLAKALPNLASVFELTHAHT